MPKLRLKEALKPVARSHGGATVPHCKNTAACQTVDLPTPNRVVIPMLQHIGAPCVPTVTVGQQVFRGQVIGDCESFVSAPIHASVSGKVTKIGEYMLPSGQKVPTVEIESDGEMRPDPSLHPVQAETLEELTEAIRDSGLVGLGGAGFPAHVKLHFKEGNHPDTLIINGAECEPYITSDHREALENANDVMDGIYTLLRLTGVERIIIAMEDNKPDALQVLYDIATSERDAKHQVFVMPMKTHYPMGAEKILVQTVTGRKIPAGKLPADVGCIVMNITTVGFLARYLKTGMPLVDKRITVDGSAIREPKNVRVPIGTPLHDVIEFCGGFIEPAERILMGGPMMGLALSDDSMPILKQTNAILAFAHEEGMFDAPTACIRCGRCINACPMRLMPTKIESMYQCKDIDGLQNAGVMVCIECGSCAFHCPAKRPLVQTMRLSKALLKKGGAAK